MLVEVLLAEPRVERTLDTMAEQIGRLQRRRGEMVERRPRLSGLDADRDLGRSVSNRVHSVQASGSIAVAALASRSVPDSPSGPLSHSSSFDHRLRPETFRTAMATAFV